jgi:hypothetical protein
VASREKGVDLRLRAECLAMVDRLEIPSPFQLRIFCDRLQEQRGRPISLQPVTLPPGSPSGLCVSTQATDYIFYEASTSAPHQEHIVLHEIGHLLWGHQRTITGSEQVLRLLLPALDPRVVIGMLERGECTGVTEQQAELVATLIMQRTARRLPGASRPAPTKDAETITRLSRTLEDPGGFHE